MYAAVALQPLEQVEIILEIILEIDLGRIGVSGAARDLRTGWRVRYSHQSYLLSALQGVFPASHFSQPLFKQLGCGRFDCNFTARHHSLCVDPPVEPIPDGLSCLLDQCFSILSIFMVMEIDQMDKIVVAFINVVSQ